MKCTVQVCTMSAKLYFLSVIVNGWFWYEMIKLMLNQLTWLLFYWEPVQKVAFDFRDFIWNIVDLTFRKDSWCSTQLFILTFAILVANANVFQICWRFFFKKYFLATYPKKTDCQTFPWQWLLRRKIHKSFEKTFWGLWHSIIILILIILTQVILS